MQPCRDGCDHNIHCLANRATFAVQTQYWQGLTVSDLLETFRIMNGKDDLIFQPDEGGRKGHGQKYIQERFRLDITKYTFVTELLTTGTHCLRISLIVIPLTLLRSNSHQNGNQEMYSYYSHLR